MFDLNTGKGHWFYLKTDNILSVKLMLTDANVFTTVNTTVFMSDGCSRSHRQQVRTLRDASSDSVVESGCFSRWLVV